MRVALKLVLVMVLILATVRVIEGVLTIQRETARLSADVERDAALMDRMLRVLIEDIWEEHGREAVIERIEAINVSQHPVKIAWVPFEGADGVGDELDPALIERLREGETVMRGDPAAAGERRHYTYTPLAIAGADGVIRTTETLAERSRYLNRSAAREVVAGGLVITIGGAAIVAWGMVFIGRPLQRFQTRLDAIGRGDLTTRLEPQGRDELSGLARGINNMCERLRASQQRERQANEQRIAALEQMQHADRLRTIGRLASGIAHELGTPLNVITGRANMIAEGDLPPDEVKQYAETIEGQGNRMVGIIRHLLDFARQRRPKQSRTPILEVVDQTVELVESLGHKSNVRVEADSHAESLRPPMDGNQIQQVLINLIENALQAMPEGGEATIAVQAIEATPPSDQDAPPGRYVRIDVRDTGVGIAPEHLDELFDPFFTTKDVGEGTGLGLSIVHGIVSEHGGWIDVASEPGRGSCFSIYLPDGETT